LLLQLLLLLLLLPLLLPPLLLLLLLPPLLLLLLPLLLLMLLLRQRLLRLQMRLLLRLLLNGWACGRRAGRAEQIAAAAAAMAPGYSLVHAQLCLMLLLDSKLHWGSLMLDVVDSMVVGSVAANGLGDVLAGASLAGAAHSFPCGSPLPRRRARQGSMRLLRVGAGCGSGRGAGTAEGALVKVSSALHCCLGGLQAQQGQYGLNHPHTNRVDS
jgi:hypothetical protein